MSEIDVADAPENSRYEARIGGELAGFADYVLREGRIVFTHTEVDDAFEGQWSRLRARPRRARRRPPLR